MKTVFLLCALALPPGWIHDDGGHTNPETIQTFLKEYQHLKNILERTYPYHEFLIIPSIYNKRPAGWDILPIQWRSHLIYKRRIRGSA